MLQLTGLDQILHAYRTVEECFELAISVASVRCLISSVVATASPQKLLRNRKSCDLTAISN